MYELICITLAITVGCNILAGIGSYLTLYTDLFEDKRIQSRTYLPNTFWQRLPLIGLNLSVVIVLAVVGLALSYSAFDFQWQGTLAVTAQFLFLVFLDDAYFYFFHRLLHLNPYLYKKMHKIHQRLRARPLGVHLRPSARVDARCRSYPRWPWHNLSSQWLNIGTCVLGICVLAKHP